MKVITIVYVLPVNDGVGSREEVGARLNAVGEAIQLVFGDHIIPSPDGQRGQATAFVTDVTSFEKSLYKVVTPEGLVTSEVMDRIKRGGDDKL